MMIGEQCSRAEGLAIGRIVQECIQRQSTAEVPLGIVVHSDRLLLSTNDGSRSSDSRLFYPMHEHRILLPWSSAERVTLLLGQSRDALSPFLQELLMMKRNRFYMHTREEEGAT